MCRLCDPDKPDLPCPVAGPSLDAGGADAGNLALPGSAEAQRAAAASLPEGVGEPGRKVLIRGGAVLSMDDALGNFVTGDVLVDGPRIAEVGATIDAPDADIILLGAEAINVAPLNHVPGAVVTLMERSNVDTVMVAGRIMKWRGQLLRFDLARLRAELEKSRDYLFTAAGIERDLFA